MTAPPPTPAVVVDRLTYGYSVRPGARPVLRDVSLTVREGEIVVLTGPSGSGKTTLLSLIGMLRRPPPGQVRLFGTDLGVACTSTLMALRRRVRIIFQKHYLLQSLTVLQNVAAGLVGDETSQPNWNVTRAAALLKAVGLEEHMHHWPDRLSGGQQQRVAVARALVALPDLLLADEPSASLDRATALQVADRIRHLAGSVGCAVLLTTHDDRIMHIATRHVRMQDGSVVEDGEPAG